MKYQAEMKYYVELKDTTFELRDDKIVIGMFPTIALAIEFLDEHHLEPYRIRGIRGLSAKKLNITTTKFIVEINNEDLEAGGYFAYGAEDTYRFPRWLLVRGWGSTELEAIACLCAVLDEEQGNEWGRTPQAFV